MGRKDMRWESKKRRGETGREGEGGGRGEK